MYIDLYNQTAVKYEFRQIFLRIEPLKESLCNTVQLHITKCAKRNVIQTLYTKQIAQRQNKTTATVKHIINTTQIDQTVIDSTENS